MTAPRASTSLPLPPARVFLVGIGGIGMSGLAQYLTARGYEVAGSDRQLEGPGRADLLDALRRQGIDIYPQDGSGPKAAAPDVVVASAAVEEGNPDFIAAAGTPRLARARALAELLNRERAEQIAVAGSAGKTSVTGWIGSALRALGHRVIVVNGGYTIESETADCPGNFSEDSGPDRIVVEVDESDKSLVEFSPDIGVLLNIGTDHHSYEDLTDVFGRFLDRCGQGCVLPWDLAGLFADHGPACRLLFGEPSQAPARAIVPTEYRPDRSGIQFALNTIGTITCRQFGRHSALNAAAVAAALRLSDPDASGPAIASALGQFAGIRQRFESIGVTASGTAVYHDYAHNVQKICAAIDTAREAAGTPLTVLFQPHGYRPLAFMRDPLQQALTGALAADDLFVFLPVFYGGGTASFSPTAAEVAESYARAGLPVTSLDHRDDAARILPDRPSSGAVLVLGARDPSLPAYASSLCDPSSTTNPPG